MMPNTTLGSSKTRVVLLADTPNLFYTVADSHGQKARPDYTELLNIGRSFGSLRAFAFVNPGVNSTFAETLEKNGFSLVRPHADDVDHAIIARAVNMHSQADWVVLCSGDGDYTQMVRLLQATGVRVAVVAAPRFCSQKLREAADEFVEVPVSGIGRRAAGAGWAQAA